MQEPVPVTEIERDPPNEIITKAAEKIKAGLSPVRQEEIDKALPTAIGIAEKMELVLKTDTARDLEKISLLLGISQEFQQGDYAKQRSLYDVIRLLFNTNERKEDRFEFPCDQIGGTDIRVAAYVLADTYPESLEFVIDDLGISLDSSFQEKKQAFAHLEWRKCLEVSRKIVRYAADNRSKDGVVKLPERNGDAGKHWKVLEKEINTMFKGEVTYSGFLGTVFYDTIFAAIGDKEMSPGFLRHEKNHIEYPGLHIFYLGSAINEAITEYMTILSVQDLDPLVRWQRWGVKFKHYENEIKMLAELKKINPTIIQRLIERYKSDTIDNSVNLITLLIDELGLDGYLSLYITDPKTESFKNKKRIVVESTKNEIKKLKRKRKEKVIWTN